MRASVSTGARIDDGGRDAVVLLALGGLAGVLLLDLTGAGEARGAALEWLVLTKAIFVVAWAIATCAHAYRVLGVAATPVLFFLMFSTFYLTVFPAVSLVSGARFVMFQGEEAGISRVQSAAMLAMVAFCLVYVVLARRPADAVGRVPGARGHVSGLLGVGVAYAFIGLAAAAWLTVFVSGLDIASYEMIGESISGKGWVIRLAELLAIGGLLIGCRALYDGNRTLLLIAIVAIAVFCVFRLQFLNRENIVKYLYVGFVFWLLMRGRSLSAREIIGLFGATGAVFFALPLLSMARVELAGISLIFDYREFFVRDLAFAEVAGVLYADPRFEGAAGLREGVLSILDQLLPRQLFPAKGYPLAVQITDAVTPVEHYDPDHPYFAYAPSYVGQYYYIGGRWLVPIYTAALAALTALVMRWAFAAPHGEMRLVRLVLASFYVFQFLVSGVKLDTGNVVAAAVIPLAATYLPASRVWARAAASLVPGSNGGGR